MLIGSARVGSSEVSHRASHGWRSTGQPRRSFQDVHGSRWVVSQTGEIISYIIASGLCL